MQSGFRLAALSSSLLAQYLSVFLKFAWHVRLHVCHFIAEQCATLEELATAQGSRA